MNVPARYVAGEDRLSYQLIIYNLCVNCRPTLLDVADTQNELAILDIEPRTTNYYLQYSTSLSCKEIKCFQHGRPS